MINNRNTNHSIDVNLDDCIKGIYDNMSFLFIVGQKGEDYGYTCFISSICIENMGTKIYECIISQVPDFPHYCKNVYNITQTPWLAKGNNKISG
jgi:hypothetical protein